MMKELKAMKLWMMIAAGVLTASWQVAFGLPQYGGPVKAKEYHVRRGIGHAMDKIKAGKSINVAYFGGSITEMDGWRRLSREWLQTEYPRCRFKEIQAAIGGTGSDLGVYRFRRDVLDHDPDLVFVEFATNDSGADPESIWANFEGFIRQAWRQDPEIDFVFVHTITSYMVKDYGAGVCPRAASAMEMLADHYGIPSVCFGPRVMADVKAGRLVMSMGEVATAVPAGAPDRDRLVNEELAKKGQVLFSADGVHPALPGHAYYLESLKAAWAAMRDLPPDDHASRLATPFYDAQLEAAKMVPIRPEMCKGHWTKLPGTDPNQARFRERAGQIWVADTPGDRLCFKFNGTRCSVYDLIGPNCGRVWITVDGKRRGPVARFDEHCFYYRLAGFSVYVGSNGVHTVEIEVDRDQPDRKIVRKIYPQANVDDPAYDGTKLYVGQIEIVGEIVE